MTKTIRRAAALIVCALVALAVIPAVQASAEVSNVLDPHDYMMKLTYTNPEISEISMPYLLYVPDTYDETRSYPVLLFLHGAGDKGTGNTHLAGANSASNLLLRNLIAGYGDDIIIVAPQCTNIVRWGWVDRKWYDGTYDFYDTEQSAMSSMAMGIFEDAVLDKYNADRTRLYIAGTSMGGFGTYDTLARYPDLFAAAVPVCGGCDPETAPLLKDVAIWSFHCANDPTVPYEYNLEMHERLTELGADVRYTQTDYFEDGSPVGHSSWIPAFNNEDLIPWLMSQSREA